MIVDLLRIICVYVIFGTDPDLYFGVSCLLFCCCCCCCVVCRYASLYFLAAIEPGDNELITLEVIHRFVELLDKYFGNVSLCVCAYMYI